MTDKYGNYSYDNKGVDSAGQYHGIGVPGQVGMKKGGFSDNVRKESRIPKKNPPRKMN